MYCGIFFCFKMVCNLINSYIVAVLWQFEHVFIINKHPCTYTLALDNFIKAYTAFYIKYKNYTKKIYRYINFSVPCKINICYVVRPILSTSLVLLESYIII